MDKNERLNELQSMFDKIEEKLQKDSIIGDLLESHRKLKDLATEAKALSEAANNKIKALNPKIIDELKKLGIEKTEKEGYSYSIKKRYNVKKENEETYFNWLRENGRGGMIKEVVSVHAKTTESFFSKDYEGDLPEFVNRWEDLSRIKQSNNKSK